MEKNDFIAGSANIQTLDKGAEGMPVIRETKDNAHLGTVMSNSFCFGGTNACLVFHAARFKLLIIWRFTNGKKITRNFSETTKGESAKR